MRIKTWKAYKCEGTNNGPKNKVVQNLEGSSLYVWSSFYLDLDPFEINEQKH